jgi:hypothetical protein
VPGPAGAAGDVEWGGRNAEALQRNRWKSGAEERGASLHLERETRQCGAWRRRIAGETRTGESPTVIRPSSSDQPVGQHSSD